MKQRRERAEAIRQFREIQSNQTGAETTIVQDGDTLRIFIINDDNLPSTPPEFVPVTAPPPYSLEDLPRDAPPAYEESIDQEKVP